MYQSIETMSDVTLLGLLVGQRNAAGLLKRADGSLSRLLCEDSGGDSVPATVLRLRVARELTRRALAETLLARDVLTSPQSVRDYLQVSLTGREHEVFMVLFLDTRHQVITFEEMFRGTLAQTSVYPREVVKRCLTTNAAAVIFAHNHPSGVAEPSQADNMLTQTLRDALALIDVRVLDHFIVAGNGILSFAERGLL